MFNVKSPWEALILIYSLYNQLQSINCSYRRTIQELLSPKTPLNVEISRCVFNGEMFQWVPWPALPSDTWTSVRQTQKSPAEGAERGELLLSKTTQSLLVLSSWTGSCEEAFDGILTGIWKDAWSGGKGPRSPRSSNEKTNFFFFRTEMSDSTLLKSTEQEKVQAYWDADLFIVMYYLIFLILDPVHCSNTRNKLNISASGWRETAGI